MSTSSASRVATLYLQAALWLPDYLGAGAPAADQAMQFVKDNVAASNKSFPNDPASVAGGVFYLTLKAANLDEDAKRMWPLLDRNAGLHLGSDMTRIGEKVFNALTRGPGTPTKEEKALLVAGLGVELLQRTRQPSKAKAVNQYFVEKYGDALASKQPGREKAKTLPLLVEEWVTPEITMKAKQVAKALGDDPEKALSLIAYLAEDINFDELSRPALAAGPSKDLDSKDLDAARGLGEFLEWGAESTIAFGIALLKAMGANKQLSRFTRDALALAKQEGLFSTRLGSVDVRFQIMAKKVVDYILECLEIGDVDSAQEKLKTGGFAIQMVYGMEAYQQMDRILHGSFAPSMPTLIKKILSTGGTHVASYDGNPSGQSIYPHQVDHGYGEPLAGGTDVMRKLQNRLLHEQGRDSRPESPRLAAARLRLPSDPSGWELYTEGNPAGVLRSVMADLNRAVRAATANPNLRAAITAARKAGQDYYGDFDRHRLENSPAWRNLVQIELTALSQQVEPVLSKHQAYGAADPEPYKIARDALHGWVLDTLGVTDDFSRKWLALT